MHHVIRAKHFFIFDDYSRTNEKIIWLIQVFGYRKFFVHIFLCFAIVSAPDYNPKKVVGNL